MSHYQERRKDGLTEEEWQAKVRAWNLALGKPHDSVFDPSGLVPYPCRHGIAAKPAAYPPTRHEPWLDADGNEKPPFAGLSWGRSKYLRINSFGGRDGVPYAIVTCPVCDGEQAPADMTTPAGEAQR